MVQSGTEFGKTLGISMLLIYVSEGRLEAHSEGRGERRCVEQVSAWTLTMSNLGACRDGTFARNRGGHNSCDGTKRAEASR